MSLKHVRGLLVLAAGMASGAAGQSVDLDALGDEAVQRLQEYIQVNTINPPGNEVRAVEFFAAIFEAEGIPYETAESAPGRGNIWARLEGGDEPALILLHHSDVVPADENHWSADPLGGVVRDGYVWGRGALDTKSLGIEHLQTFLALHRSGRPLTRDVIFMATADEEAGGLFGAGWLVEHRPELFANVGWVLNEGGGGERVDGRVSFGVEVTQKVPFWFRLVSTGEPGHGSTPRTISSVTRLLQGLENLRNHPFPPRIVPAVDAYFKAIAPAAAPEWREAYGDMATAVTDAAFLNRLQLASPFLHGLTRNTCSITRLGASNKINVVPPQAWAEIDCRVLPDQEYDAFVAELAFVVNDPMIEIEKIMAFTPAVSSTDTDLYRAMVAVIGEHYPEAPMVPSVSTGFTDSHFLRDLGIVSYGFDTAVIPDEISGGVHGNDERVPVDEVRKGTRLMYEIVSRVVY